MIFSILIILVCILLIFVVLVQNSKGGGIQSQYSAATQIMGVKRGTEFIEKATWALAIVLIGLSILMAPKGTGTSTGTEESGSVAKKVAGSSPNIPTQSAPVNQAPVNQAPAPQNPAPTTQPE